MVAVTVKRRRWGRVLAVVMLVASLFQVGLGVVSGNVGWLAVLLAALAVLGLVFAARARAEAVDR